MVLTDTQIRQSKPKSKPFKLSDGGGLAPNIKASLIESGAFFMSGRTVTESVRVDSARTIELDVPSFSFSALSPHIVRSGRPWPSPFQVAQTCVQFCCRQNC